MHKFLNSLSWPLVIMACLTLGLAPFKPAPHIWEKLIMLVSGELGKPADVFDLLMHGTPWLLLILKGMLLKAGNR